MLIILGCSNIDKNMYPELSKSNLRKYKGKEVSVFLNNINKQYFDYYFLERRPGMLVGCSFHFEEYFIYIYITRGNYESFNIKSDWKLDDFLKEKISHIEYIIWSESS